MFAVYQCGEVLGLVVTNGWRTQAIYHSYYREHKKNYGKGINHIFFDVSNANFTITAATDTTAQQLPLV
ncbi:MAG: hypothetical protein IPO23_08910 [Flavobacterium sp.]|nr:hypothetical protein [Flavobacterium sp.]